MVNGSIDIVRWLMYDGDSNYDIDDNDNDA
jgi:hypothetical protein